MMMMMMMVFDTHCLPPACLCLGCKPENRNIAVMMMSIIKAVKMKGV